MPNRLLALTSCASPRTIRPARSRAAGAKMVIGTDKERERRVKSVDHAIDILDLLAGPLRSAGVTQLSTRLGMNVSTVHHLLRTLQARRLVEQDPDSKLYRLGVRS